MLPIETPADALHAQYLEPADVARRGRCVPATVRWWADTGQLPVAATTARGGRLFRADDVAEFLRLRELRRAAHAQREARGEQPTR